MNDSLGGLQQKRINGQQSYDIIVDAISKMAEDQINKGYCPVCNGRIVRIDVKKVGSSESNHWVIRCMNCKVDLSSSNIYKIAGLFLGVGNISRFVTHLLANINNSAVLAACAPINGEKH